MINKLLGELVSLERDIDDLETRLKDLKDRERLIKEDLLPDVLDSMGVSELILTDGTKVSIVNNIVCSVSRENSSVIGEALREYGGESIIKSLVKVDLPKGNEEKLKDLYDKLDGFDFTTTEDIHPMSLKKFIRVKLDEGEDIDLKRFGAFILRSAKIKR